MKSTGKDILRNKGCINSSIPQPLKLLCREVVFDTQMPVFEGKCDLLVLGITH